MPTYYTVIPGHEELSAEVDAPDKRHGRTVYLDFLTRNGVISYGERTTYRRKVKMDKMDPGETPTSTRLVYSYATEESPVQSEETMSAVPQVPVYKEPQGEPIAIDNSFQAEQPVPQSSLSPLTSHSSPDIYFGSKSLIGNQSPIMQLSKSAGGK